MEVSRAFCSSERKSAKRKVLPKGRAWSQCGKQVKAGNGQTTSHLAKLASKVSD